MAGQFAQQVLSTLGVASTLFSLKTFCLPGNPCFPDVHAFSALNASLNGNLIQPEIPDFACVTAECFSQVGSAPPGRFRRAADHARRPRSRGGRSSPIS